MPSVGSWCTMALTTGSPSIGELGSGLGVGGKNVSPALSTCVDPRRNHHTGWGYLRTSARQNPPCPRRRAGRGSHTGITGKVLEEPSQTSLMSLRVFSTLPAQVGAWPDWPVVPGWPTGSRPGTHGSLVEDHRAGNGLSARWRWLPSHLGRCRRQLRVGALPGPGRLAHGAPGLRRRDECPGPTSRHKSKRSAIIQSREPA
jgi:hypothetical protein